MPKQTIYIVMATHENESEVTALSAHKNDESAAMKALEALQAAAKEYDEDYAEGYDTWVIALELED